MTCEGPLRTPEGYIELFETVILGAQEVGVAGEWNATRRRLEAIARQAEAIARTRAPSDEGRLLLLHREVAVEVLSELFAPRVLDLLKIELSERRRADPRSGAWIWLELDRTFETARERAQTRARSAEAALIAAFEHYRARPQGGGSTRVFERSRISSMPSPPSLRYTRRVGWSPGTRNSPGCSRQGYPCVRGNCSGS